MARKLRPGAGRGIAAGKVVISDSATASAFGGGVIAVAPDEVDDVIRSHVADPARYRAQVARGQQALAAFGAARFAAMLDQVVHAPVGAAA